MARTRSRFAGHSLDLARFSLSGPAGEVALRPKSFEVLRYLVEHHGRVVTKDELIQAVWPGVTVTDESVTRCISDVRHALDDAEQRIVKTIPRRGYLLDVAVEHETDATNDLAATGNGGGRHLAVAAAPSAADMRPDPVTPPFRGGGPERRLLTILVCSLADSVAHSARLDPEDLQELTSAFHATLRTVIERHGGVLARATTDGAVGYFGYPIAREEDAEQAVYAALAASEAVAALHLPSIPRGVQARLGVATGLVVVGDASAGGTLVEHMLAGEAPLLAARLCSLASPGTIAISPGTRRQLGDIFEYRTPDAHEQARGLAPIEASVVLRESAIANRFDALHRSGKSALVGRVDELETLLRLWGQAASVSGRVVQIVGEAGIGKSRLTQALLERPGPEPIFHLQYFCSPNYADSALHPITSQLAEAAGIDRNDAAPRKLAKLEALFANSGKDIKAIVSLLAPLLSIPLGPGYPPPPLNPQRRKELTFDALLQQLAAVGKRRPILIVFEDAHWMDPTSIELLSLLIDRVPALSVLLVITARPEFTPSWPQHSHISMLHLGRLGQRDGEALAQGLVDGRRLPPELLREINEHTDGVPLFIEELTKTVLESGALKVEGDHYVLTQALPSLSIPSTLHASLLSRLDRLGPTKRIAQIASAIGREFSYGLIAAVADMPEPDLRAALDQLVATGLVFRRGQPPEATYLFKHALLRDAAYASLVRGNRRALHGVIATQLIKQATSDEQIKPELIAHHCAEAGSAEAAIRYYLLAGAEAVARSALTESSALFEKAIAQVGQLAQGRERDAKELEVQSARGASLIAVKGYGAAETGGAYARAKELWDRLGKPLALVHVVRGLWLYHINHKDYDQAQALAREVMTLSRQHNDIEGEILSLHCIGAVDMFRGKLEQGRKTIEDAHRLYDANVERQLFKGLAGYDPNVLGLALLAWGLSLLGFHEQALAHSSESLRRARRSGRAPDIASSLEIREKLPMLSNEDFGTGYAELQALADQHGFPYWVAEARIVHGELELRRGNAAEAVAILTQGIEAQRNGGGAYWSGHHAIQLSAALEQSGRRPEALTLLDRAIDAAEKTDDRWYLAELYRRRAVLELAGPGADQVKAEADLQTALAIARDQNAKLWELRTTTSLARHWRDTGRSAAASKLLQPVHAWFTEGLASADMIAAHTLLAELKA